MRIFRAWSPLIALVIALLVGRWLSASDPSAKVYWNWLGWSGVALGVLNGAWAGKLTTMARSWFWAATTGASVASGLAILQAVAYRVLLPDALMLPPGQVPQENFTAWLLGGMGLVPAAAITGGVWGWWAWRVTEDNPRKPARV